MITVESTQLEIIEVDTTLEIYINVMFTSLRCASDMYMWHKLSLQNVHKFITTIFLSAYKD